MFVPVPISIDAVSTSDVACRQQEQSEDVTMTTSCSSSAMAYAAISHAAFLRSLQHGVAGLVGWPSYHPFFSQTYGSRCTSPPSGSGRTVIEDEVFRRDQAWSELMLSETTSRTDERPTSSSPSSSSSSFSCSPWTGQDERADSRATQRHEVARNNSLIVRNFARHQTSTTRTISPYPLPNISSYPLMELQSLYPPNAPHDSEGVMDPVDTSIGGGGVGGGSGGLRPRNAARESTTATLKMWLREHIKNPYPAKADKIMLAIITKMTLTQVSTWFANARRRLKKESGLVWQDENDEEVDRAEEEEEVMNERAGRQLNNVAVSGDAEVSPDADRRRFRARIVREMPKDVGRGLILSGVTSGDRDEGTRRGRVDTWYNRQPRHENRVNSIIVNNRGDAESNCSDTDNKYCEFKPTINHKEDEDVSKHHRRVAGYVRVISNDVTRQSADITESDSGSSSDISHGCAAVDLSPRRRHKMSPRLEQFRNLSKSFPPYSVFEQGAFLSASTSSVPSLQSSDSKSNSFSLSLGLAEHVIYNTTADTSSSSTVAGKPCSSPPKVFQSSRQAPTGIALAAPSAKPRIWSVADLVTSSDKDVENNDARL